MDRYHKISKQSKIHILLLTIFTILLVVFITRFQFLYGSNVDWIRQHIVFPDYFRNLFYETGDLLPNFSLHLGGGQNIFYFAYYGLLNPIIIISYLFPFISMGTYMILSSIFMVLLSLYLFYYFLRQNHFSNNICFVVTLLFLFSSSFLFHSHRHIMFVNYMPFLILGLIGINRYFEKHKSGLLIASIALMILTSYYYSVSGLIGLCLYGLFYYLKGVQTKWNWKLFLKESFLFLLRVIHGIFLASILLFPIIYTVLNGRIGEGTIFSLESLFPFVNLDSIIYGTYGVGLSAVLWISLIYTLLFMKREYKIISFCLFIIISIPFISNLLNGGLYINGKAFIPFLPLFLFLIAAMLKDILANKKSYIWLMIAAIGSSLFFIRWNWTANYIYYYLELLVSVLLLTQFQKTGKYLYLLPIILSLFTISLINHYQDDLISIEKYQKQQEYDSYPVSDYINQDTTSLYRYQDMVSGSDRMNFSYAKKDYRTTLYSSTTNLSYLSNFYSTFQNNDSYRNYLMLNQTGNLFFMRYMGIRYLLSNNIVPYGYQEIQKYKNANLYENENVYPIAFQMNHLLNQKEYQQLSDMEKLESYQNNVIISGNSKNPNLEFLSQKIVLDYEISKQENITIQKKEKSYIIQSKEQAKIQLKLKQPLEDHSLLIHFRLKKAPKCRDGDISITINNVLNKLTCRSWKYYNKNETFHYMISSNKEIQELNIKFSKGKYEISDIEIYQIPNELFQKKEEITELNIDPTKKNSEVIRGNITSLEDGYLIFTIPYDKGFKLFIDGKEATIEKVNDIFIGTKITKGNHEVTLEFRAPYFFLGKLVSMLAISALGGVMLLERGSGKKKKV